MDRSSLNDSYLSLFEIEIHRFLSLIKKKKIKPDKDGIFKMLIYRGPNVGRARNVVVYLTEKEETQSKPRFTLVTEAHGVVWEVHIFSTQTQTNA